MNMNDNNYKKSGAKFGGCAQHPSQLAHPKNSAINTKPTAQYPSFIALLFGCAARAAEYKSFPFLFFEVFVFSFFKNVFSGLIDEVKTIHQHWMGTIACKYIHFLFMLVFETQDFLMKVSFTKQFFSSPPLIPYGAEHETKFGKANKKYNMACLLR